MNTRELYIRRFEQILVLANEGVLGLGEDSKEIRFGEGSEGGDDG
jgi:hypothetical protein